MKWLTRKTYVHHETGEIVKWNEEEMYIIKSSTHFWVNSYKVYKQKSNSYEIRKTGIRDITVIINTKRSKQGSIF